MNSLSTIDDEDAFLYGHPHPPGEEPARSSSRDPRLRKRLSSEGHQGPEPRSMSHDSRGSSDIFPPGDLPVGKLKEKYDRERSRRSRSRDRRSRSPRDRRYDRRGGDGAGDDEAWKRKAEAFLQGIGATDTRPNVHQQFATANYGQAYPASTMGYGQFGGASQLPPGFPNMSIPPPVVSGFPGAPGLPTSDRGRSPGHRRRTRSRSRDRRNRRERERRRHESPSPVRSRHRRRSGERGRSPRRSRPRSGRHRSRSRERRSRSRDRRSRSHERRGSPPRGRRSRSREKRHAVFKPLSPQQFKPQSPEAMRFPSPVPRPASPETIRLRIPSPASRRMMHGSPDRGHHRLPDRGHQRSPPPMFSDRRSPFNDARPPHRHVSPERFREAGISLSPLRRLYHELDERDRRLAEFEARGIRVPSPPRIGSLNPLFNTGGDRAAPRPPPEPQTEETLRPGNYLVCFWEALTLGGSQSATTVFFQLGGFLPHGQSYLMYVLPDNLKNMEEATEQNLVRYIKMSNQWFVQPDHSRHFLTPVDTKKCLVEFLSFLEKGCQSIRPSYDGVLLVSHFQESIPMLLRTVKKVDLQERFQKVVKGMGDLCSYMAQCHSKKFIDETNPSSKMDLTLRTAYGILFGKRFFSKNSDARAKASYEILEKLLEATPNYANFFRDYVHPLKSKLLTRMANFRTNSERMELFRPLQRYIAKELAKQQVEIIIEGMYAPSAEEEDKQLSEPQQVAYTMCRLLVAAGFDFDKLLEMYNKQGLVELELKLRTVFLGKMAGQSRQIVDQTIRTTRLAVAFFRDNGHKSLQDLLESAKQAELAEQSNTQEARQDQEVTEEEYKTKFLAFQPTAEYFVKRLARILSDKGTEEIKIVSDMLINCMLQSGLYFEILLSVYEEDKQKYRHRNIFRKYLTDTLSDKYRVHGPENLALSQMVELLIDFCGNHRFQVKKTQMQPTESKTPTGSLMNPLFAASGGQQQKQQPEPSGSSAISEKEMKMCSEALSQAVGETFGGASRIDYKQRLLSLQALDIFLGKFYMEIGIGNELLAKALASHVHRLLAYHGFSHYWLKEKFQESETTFAGQLFAVMREKADFIPMGIAKEMLVESVVKYFKLQSLKHFM